MLKKKVSYRNKDEGDRGHEVKEREGVEVEVGEEDIGKSHANSVTDHR